MKRISGSIRCLVFGLLVTAAQIGVSVCLLAPHQDFSDRYATLVQHDGYWFANIVDRGYATTIPPVDHKVMEVSNVAFFPAYPAVAGILHHIFHLSTPAALLVTAQAAAWGFLELFLPLLRTVEPLALAAVFRRAEYRRSSGGVFSGGRLFRVALSHGAARFYLLEQCRRTPGDFPGGLAWLRHVGHANRWDSVRGFPGRARGL